MHRRPDRGASAVEFALVAPLLFVLLYGIIDYGLWFADQISLRQAAAASARMAGAWSVDDSTIPPWEPAAGCGSWDSQTSKEIQTLGCAALSSVHPLGGQVYVKIRILSPDQLPSTSPTSTTDWAKPNAVRVCLLQVHPSITGFIPLPRDVITARVDMPLEGTNHTQRTIVEGQQLLPSGYSWSPSCP